MDEAKESETKTTQKMPRLIQRMRRKPEEEGGERQGVDRRFAMDYMGASEFEWGALPRALKELRAAKLTGPIQITATTGEKIHFVGPEALIPSAAMLFEQALRPTEHERISRPLENPFIYETYTGRSSWNGRMAPERERFDAWWCIDHGRGFVLFKQKEDAETWLKCMKEVVILKMKEKRT